jgi:hypothetical protein
MGSGEPRPGLNAIERLIERNVDLDFTRMNRRRQVDDAADNQRHGRRPPEWNSCRHAREEGHFPHELSATSANQQFEATPRRAGGAG